MWPELHMIACMLVLVRSIWIGLVPEWQHPASIVMMTGRCDGINCSVLRSSPVHPRQWSLFVGTSTLQSNFLGNLYHSTIFSRFT